MKKSFLRRLLHSAFCLLPIASFSQVKDAGLWASATAKYNFSLELSAEVTEEFRFNENISELGSYFTDVGIGYKLLKGTLRTSAHYRFINNRRLDDSYSKRHRWYIDLGYRLNAKPFEVTLRTRLQSQYADVFSSDDGKVPSYRWRNKLTLGLDLEKKWQPYISAELFTDVEDRINDNVRYAIGVDYEINKIHSINLFYLHQREFNTEDPYWDYIFGFGYSINIDYLIGSEE